MNKLKTLLEKRENPASKYEQFRASMEIPVLLGNNAEALLEVVEAARSLCDYMAQKTYKEEYPLWSDLDDALAKLPEDF